MRCDVYTCGQRVCIGVPLYALLCRYRRLRRILIYRILSALDGAGVLCVAVTKKVLDFTNLGVVY